MCEYLSLLLAEVYKPCLGTSSPKPAGFLLLDTSHERGVVDGSPTFLRVSSRKLRSRMTESFLQHSSFINLPHPLATSYITPSASLSHSPGHVFSLSFPPLPLSLLISFFLFSTGIHYCLWAFLNIPDPFLPFFSFLLLFFFWSSLSLSLSLTLLHLPPHRRDTRDQLDPSDAGRSWIGVAMAKSQLPC